MHVDTMTVERRRHPRTLSHTEAVVHDGRHIMRYVVSNLSVGGGLLIGPSPLQVGTRVDVILQLPLYPEVRVHGDVIRCTTNDDGEVEIAMSFVHHDDRTEDHIQSALLSEIERSQTQGQIADVM
jgi:hypothetical protein